MKERPTKKEIVKDLMETYLKRLTEYLPRLIKGDDKNKFHFYLSIWSYSMGLEYLIKYAKNINLDTNQLEEQFTKLKIKIQNAIEKIGKKRFWTEIQKELEFYFKRIGKSPTGLGSFAFSWDEMDSILAARNKVQFAMRFFPKEYGNFDDKKEDLARWDKELREKADFLRYDEEYKSHRIGSFWLPKEEFWWNFIWDKKEDPLEKKRVIEKIQIEELDTFIGFTIWKLDSAMSKISFLRAGKKLQQGIYIEIFCSIIQLDYLLKFAARKNAQKEIWKTKSIQVKKIYQKILESQKDHFWIETKKEFEELFEKQSSVSSFISVLEKNESSEIGLMILLRTYMEFAVRFFPKGYGDFRQYKEKLAKWDKFFRSKIPEFLENPEYKNMKNPDYRYTTVSYWLPKKEYWWNFIWDAEDWLGIETPRESGESISELEKDNPTSLKEPKETENQRT